MADYDYLPVSNGSGDAALMHITASRLVGGTTITVDSTTNVPTKFVGTYGTLLATNLLDPTTKRDFKGHVIDGTHIGIDAFEPGSTDSANLASGQVVVVKPNTGWANRVAAFIKNATGFGTPENVTFAQITGTSLVNATHNHQNSAGGGTLSETALNWGTFALNMKSVVNSGSTISNATLDLASQGLTLSFTVAQNCNALVSVSLGIGSTSDFEFQPQIRVDGSVVTFIAPNAAPGLPTSRSTMRGFTAVIPLTAGSHTISAGVFLSSGTSLIFNAGGSSLSALILGTVTA